MIPPTLNAVRCLSFSVCLQFCNLVFHGYTRIGFGQATSDAVVINVARWPAQKTSSCVELEETRAGVKRWMVLVHAITAMSLAQHCQLGFGSSMSEGEEEGRSG